MTGPIGTLGDAAWRDYVTDGVPSSGVQQPLKSDIRAFVAALEGGVVPSVMWYGAEGDGVTDDTAAFAAALAAFTVVAVPQGTYIVDGLDIPSGKELRGVGARAVTLKRKAASVLNYVVRISARSSVVVRDLTIDGNKASQTVGAHNLLVADSNDVAVDIRSINAKGVSTEYGTGVYVEDNTDVAQDTRSTFRIDAIDNDYTGLLITRCNSVQAIGGFFKGHTFSGIACADPTKPIVGDATRGIVISGNIAVENGVGISVQGFENEITGLGNVQQQRPLAHACITVADNVCRSNTVYGIKAQGVGLAVTGNVTELNGNSTSNGNILFNAAGSLLANNVSRKAYYFGIDAGGCTACLIASNLIEDSGTAIGQGIGINVGGTTYTRIADNKINLVGGGSGGSYGILASALDGGGNTAFFPWVGSHLSIVGNEFLLTHANNVAVRLTNDWLGAVTVRDNIVYNNGAASNPFQIVQTGGTSGKPSVKGNLVYTAAGNKNVTVASATTLVIPDHAEVVNVTGTTDIETIKFQSEDDYTEGVFATTVSNVGSGYTSAPGVTFTGGGGTGAAGTAALAADGTIIGVYMTNPGSGYVTAPTVGFTGGGGSGAVATAFVSLASKEGREITLVFADASTIKNGTGNIYTSDGRDFVPSASARSTITLHGKGTIWLAAAPATIYYEEGDWTPVVAGSSVAGTQTYTNQYGTYERIGNLVIVRFRLDMSTLDVAAAGNFTITGLPFTSRNDNVNTAGWVSLINKIAHGTDFLQFGIRVAFNSARIDVQEFGQQVAATAQNVPITALATDGITVVGGVAYRV